MNTYLTMHEKIEDLIVESGKHLEEIANEITEQYCPISKATLSDMANSEKKEKNFGYKYIVAVAKYFNVSTDYLLTETDIKTNDIEAKKVCDYTGLNDKTIEFFNKNNPINTVKYNTPKKTIIDFIEFLICEYKNGVPISDELYYLLEITKKAKDIASEFSSMSDEEVFKEKNKIFREYRKRITHLTDMAFEKKYRAFELFQHLINAYIVNRCDCSLDSIEETVSERQLKLPNSKKLAKAFRVPLADNEIEFRIAGEENE